MGYHFYKPQFPLSQFIDSFIYYEGIYVEHTVDRFLPNGDTEILIDFDDTPQYIYDNDSLKEIQACHNIWASGVRTEPITIPSGSMARMMVIMCKKGMAYPFFPFPMDEIVDSVLDADLIWGSSFAYLREKLLAAAPNIDRMFKLTEDFLVKNFLGPTVLNPCVEYAVAEIVRQPDQINLSRLSAKIGYSQKHFIGMFKRQVGVAPKSFLKILRFQKAIGDIERSVRVDWTAISHESGFYDQAHFINDFKTFSGFTPEQYLKHKNDLLNYVPVG
jgi:AraC-like DNA-binding protein